MPDDVFAAVVDVLRGWGWERRPAAVVAVASGRRPLLVASLAERIAATGQMVHLGKPTAQTQALNLSLHLSLAAPNPGCDGFRPYTSLEPGNA